MSLYLLFSLSLYRFLPPLLRWPLVHNFLGCPVSEFAVSECASVFSMLLDARFSLCEARLGL